jgi:hypothetical protein
MTAVDNLLHLSRFVLDGCLLASIPPVGAEPLRPEHRRGVARRDLDYIHKSLLEAHPGAMDPENPTFRQWLEDGYVNALALLPLVHDY